MAVWGLAAWGSEVAWLLRSRLRSTGSAVGRGPDPDDRARVLLRRTDPQRARDAARAVPAPGGGHGHAPGPGGSRAGRRRFDRRLVRVDARRAATRPPHQS